jgi:hypothetical protein
MYQSFNRSGATDIHVFRREFKASELLPRGKRALCSQVMEIRETNDRTFKEGLKHKEGVIKKILAALQ